MDEATLTQADWNSIMLFVPILEYSDHVLVSLKYLVLDKCQRVFKEGYAEL